MASSFSPTPANLMGLPVTALTESAAPPAGVAVELGEHHAGDAERFVKGGGGVHGVLAGHRVHNEQNLRRFGLGLDAAQLVHERLVDVEASGGIEEYEIVSVAAAWSIAWLCDLHRSPWPSRIRKIELLPTVLS